MGKMKQYAEMSIEQKREYIVEMMQRVENVSETVVEVLRNPELAEHHVDALENLTNFTIAKAALNARLTMLEGWGKL